MLRLALILALLAACDRTSAGKPPGEAGAMPRPAATAPTPAAASTPTPASAEPGQPIPAFTAQGLILTKDGASPVALDSRATARPTAYVFLGTRCPTTARYLGRLAELEARYAGAVDFVHLYPNRTDSLDEKRAFHGAAGLRGPLVDDQGAVLATLLAGTRTAEAVIASKDGVIVYRGAIDDAKDPSKVTRHHLAAALDEHLAGRPVSQPKTEGTA